MKKRNIMFLSIISLAIGIFFIINSETNITGAVISSSNISSTFSSILGVLLILVSIILFIFAENLEEKLDDNIRLISTRVKKDTLLLNIARDVCNKEKIKRDIDHLMKMFNKGSDSPGAGTRNVFAGVYELKGRNGGRVYYHQIGNNKYEILGYSDKHTQSKVINRLMELYG